MLRDLPKTGLVIPCYNEAARLPVAAITEELARSPYLTLCLVNDGSTDRTQLLLENLQREWPEQCQALALPSNSGKAEAVRRGIHELCRRQELHFVGFWDADMATPLAEHRAFLDVARRLPRCRFICGSRVRRLGASVERRAIRHLLGRVFATAVSLWLELPVYDTQCGAKLFEANLARTLFAAPFVSRWFFDVELFKRALLCLGHEAASEVFYEYPLQAWEDKRGSKLTVGSHVAALVDLLRMMRHYARQSPPVTER